MSRFTLSQSIPENFDLSRLSLFLYLNSHQLAICYGLWITLETLLFGNPVGGWPTLAASVMLFSGVQLLSIGILGEYIGRIYEEVKQRPVYLLAQDEDHSPLAREAGAGAAPAPATAAPANANVGTGTHTDPGTA